MKKNRNKFCAVLDTLDIIGGKWKLPIISQLQDGTKRFKELEHGIEGITARMLSKDLKELEAYKIVNRKIYAEVPPRVEYSLTNKGKSLKSLILEIKNWGNQYLDTGKKP